jgi:hypothetical protein
MVKMSYVGIVKENILQDLAEEFQKRGIAYVFIKEDSKYYKVYMSETRKDEWKGILYRTLSKKERR